MRTQSAFPVEFPFSGVTDSALPTLYSTSLPRGLMPLSPFVLATACHCYSAGDIKALEHCTQLTMVDFYECRQVTGESSGGRFLSELRTSPLFL